MEGERKKRQRGRRYVGMKLARTKQRLGRIYVPLGDENSRETILIPALCMTHALISRNSIRGIMSGSRRRDRFWETALRPSSGYNLVGISSFITRVLRFLSPIVSFLTSWCKLLKINSSPFHSSFRLFSPKYTLLYSNCRNVGILLPIIFHFNRRFERKRGSISKKKKRREKGRTNRIEGIVESLARRDA